MCNVSKIFCEKISVDVLYLNILLEVLQSSRKKERGVGWGQEKEEEERKTYLVLLSP